MPEKRKRSLCHVASGSCPVENAIQAIGGKWKMLVLRSLLLNGTQRYNELLVSVSSISPKELTRNLRELRDIGLVAQQPGSGGPSTSYSLTEVGSLLLPAFERLAPFGERLAAASAPKSSESTDGSIEEGILEDP
jgi:DNA-binding HxlR family transcriptional regulator